MKQALGEILLFATFVAAYTLKIKHINKQLNIRKWDM